MAKKDQSKKKNAERVAELLQIRQDMVTLLVYLRDNRITGTQSLGNLPLKAIREVTAKFINPPVLDTDIGGRIYKLRSEDEIWSLVLLHAIAEVGELLLGGRSRRLRLTPKGDEFLAVTSLAQVRYMFVTWWTRVNWLIAYSIAGMDDGLPKYFGYDTLTNLLSLKVDSWVNFESFADELIKETGLRWTSEDTTHFQRLLHGAVKKMVINILIDFGAANAEYRENPILGAPYKDLVSFKITDFGRGLLKMVDSLS